MDPNKNNTFDMDVRSPLREINVQNNTNPEQNNSPNKTVNLLDATTTTFENSILMPATDSDDNTLDVTSTTNRENQRPRFSLLGTFDPIFQKKESTDNGKSDSAADVGLLTLIEDEILYNKSDGKEKLPIPENELNKSNVSNVSSVSDVSEQNNTVILSKTFTEVQGVKEESGAANNPESVSVTPIKFVPVVGGSDLSDSFLEKFNKAAVISTPGSVKSTEPKEDTVSQKLAEELDTDSIDLENPVSQSEDFDTDSLNEEIESAQNEILHEISVESSKIVSELNKTQETEKLQAPIQLEQKEQIIQEINITYSEPISPTKLERQEDIEKEINSLSQEINLTQIAEQTSPRKDTSLLFEAICCDPNSPNKNTSLEISGKFDDPLDSEQLIPQESDNKITPVKLFDNNSFEISTPVAKTAPEAISEEPINKNISFVIEASSPIAKPQPQSPQKLKEIILNKDIVKPEDKNISFVIESSPIVKPSSETPEKLSDITINKEEIISSPIVKAEDSVIQSSPVVKSSSESEEPIVKGEDSQFIETPEKLPENEQISSAVNKNISFVIESAPTVKPSSETPEKLIKEEITSSPIVKPVDSAVNKNISFVIESAPIVKPSSETPEKLIKEEIISSPIVKPEDSAVNKNISFVIESAPIVKPSSETPEKLIKEEITSSPIVKPEDSAVNKNISFVIESATIVKPSSETPEKLTKEEITSSPIVKPEDSAVNTNISFVIESTPVQETPEKLPENDQISSAVNKNISFVIESSPIVKSGAGTPQKLIEEEITSSPIVKPEDLVPETPKILPEKEQLPSAIISPIIEKVKSETPQKIETVISEDLGVTPLEVASDEIIKTPEPIEETLATPVVEPVIPATSEEIKDKHMSEANPIEKLEVSESAVTNSVPTNEMGEVINQIDCFQKQSDITNGAVDNKESLDPKNEMYNEMVERLSLLEGECERYKTQVAALKREIKTCRQKSASLESEVADLKRKENELNILLDEYKNKKPEESADATDGKEEELKLLRASEESLKNEIIELKVLVKQHENKLKDLQQKEVKLADDLTSKTQSELQISRVMDEYEKSISSLVAENEKMKKERDTAQMHLSNIELAFSDVHQKYERCKRVVQGYKDNEDSFRHDIATNRETIATQEQRYATLKSHAMAQLEKSNQELLGIKKQHETEMARLTAQLKRYEIKNDSLMEALQQKTKECEQLSAVCDEFIGNV